LYVVALAVRDRPGAICQTGTLLTHFSSRRTILSVAIAGAKMGWVRIFTRWAWARRSV